MFEAKQVLEIGFQQRLNGKNIKHRTIHEIDTIFLLLLLCNFYSFITFNSKWHFKFDF